MTYRGVCVDNEYGTLMRIDGPEDVSAYSVVNGYQWMCFEFVEVCKGGSVEEYGAVVSFNDIPGDACCLSLAYESDQSFSLEKIKWASNATCPLDILGSSLMLYKFRLNALDISYDGVEEAAEMLWSSDPFLFIEYNGLTRSGIVYASENAGISLIIAFDKILLGKASSHDPTPVRVKNPATSTALDSMSTDRKGRKWKLLDRKKLNDIVYTEEIVAHGSVIGCIIGKQGENLSTLSRIHKVEIRVYPDDNGIRTLKITSPNREGVKKVCEFLEFIYYKFKVPPHLASKIEKIASSAAFKSLATQTGMHSMWYKPHEHEFYFCGVKSKVTEVITALNKALNSPQYKTDSNPSSEPKKARKPLATKPRKRIPVDGNSYRQPSFIH